MKETVENSKVKTRPLSNRLICLNGAESLFSSDNRSAAEGILVSNGTRTFIALLEAATRPWAGTHWCNSHPYSPFLYISYIVLFASLRSGGKFTCPSVHTHITIRERLNEFGSNLMWRLCRGRLVGSFNMTDAEVREVGCKNSNIIVSSQRHITPSHDFQNRL